MGRHGGWVGKDMTLGDDPTAFERGNLVAVPDLQESVDRRVEVLVQSTNNHSNARTGSCSRGAEDPATRVGAPRKHPGGSREVFGANCAETVRDGASDRFA